jgi:hypothetical protein
MRWFLGTTLWIRARYCKSPLSLVKHTSYRISNGHRLKSAREQPPPYSNDCTPILFSSENYGSGEPEVLPIKSLRCMICHGNRSPRYLRRHSSDPIRFPAVGICSRRRTKCKLYQSRWSASTVDLLAIPELPGDWHMVQTESALKKPIPVFDAVV